MTSAQLRAALAVSVDYLARKGVRVDWRLWDAIKTVAYYTSHIEALIRDLYNGDISTTDFENGLVDLVDQQLERAWREGMRANGLDPAKDMTPEFVAELDRIKLEELDHIPGFAEAINEAEAKDAESGNTDAALPGLYVRGGAWAARYTDVVNQATVFTAEPKDRLEWVYGDTEHCETCAALNGIVASAEEWDASGFHPQQPENDKLSCGGWRCKCELVPTTKYRTRNRFDIWDSLSV